MKQIHTRLPDALHDQLATAAEGQGMSLNRLLVVLLAGGVGFKLTPKESGMTDRELGVQLGAEWARGMDERKMVMRGPDDEPIDAVALVASGEIPEPVRDQIRRYRRFGLDVPEPEESEEFWQGISEGAKRQADATVAQIGDLGMGRN